MTRRNVMGFIFFFSFSNKLILKKKILHEKLVCLIAAIAAAQ